MFVSETPWSQEAHAHPGAILGSPRKGPLATETRPETICRWLAGALDELDYGIVLLFEGTHVVHINHAARVALDQDHALQMLGNELRARFARDVPALDDAIEFATQRGRRCLLTLGDQKVQSSISIVPLEAAEGGPHAVLVVLGKRAVSEALSMDGFARQYGLTGAETRVLIALCSGLPPLEAARQLGVAISTIRTQIACVRAKTGAASIRALIRQVAVLPPVRSALRCQAPRPLPRLSALAEMTLPAPPRACGGSGLLEDQMGLLTGRLHSSP
jgi:DNA-binding CsgD family transcriptional regulator